MNAPSPRSNVLRPEENGGARQRLADRVEVDERRRDADLAPAVGATAATALARATAEALFVFIFQLPATKGVRGIM